MRRKHSVVLYNMIFPVFIIFSPPVLIFSSFLGGKWGFFLMAAVFGGNLLIDWLVTALALRLQKIAGVVKKSLSVLLRVWLAGFAADFLSSLALFVLMCFSGWDWFGDNVVGYFYNSIYRSPYALAVTLAAIGFGGWLIYRFNVRWALEPAELTEQQCKRTALVLAVLTAPWLFMLPASLFY